MFLMVGATRKALQLVASNCETSTDHSPKSAAGTFDIAYLILRVLPSKDGASFRRLLMTVNGASLIRRGLAMVSKEGKVICQQLCKVIADALCQWMIKLFGQGATDGPSNKESGRSSS